MSFEKLGLCSEILKSIEEKGYVNPTEIQERAIPQVLMGRDLLGCAQTGTGKTGSFIMPIIEILNTGKAKSRMPRSLVLAPTRELAMQVSEEFNLINKHLKLQMALLIGGISFVEQDNKLAKGVDVLIATPGRLLDHMERGKVILKDLKILVIDEADRMLDMGFLRDIKRIISLLPSKTQNLLFSATFSKDIKKLATEFLYQPAIVEVSPENSTVDKINRILFLIKILMLTAMFYIISSTMLATLILL